MEPTEPILPEQPKPELLLSEEAKYYLHSIGRWANFFSVLGFIATGFILLVVIFIGVLFSTITNMQQAFAGAGGVAASSVMGAGLGIIRFIYLGIAVINFFGAFYLGKFASRIKKGIVLNDSITTAEAFANLKSFFKLIGITTIVALAIDVLFIVIGLIVALGTAAMR